MRRAALLLIVLLALGGAMPVAAVSPYRTYTLGPGQVLYPTQDAYTPLDQIDLPLSSPEDMFLAPDGALYIADTGNGRIVRLDDTLQVAAEYGVGALDAPTGVSVDARGTMYIADAGSNSIVILDRDGHLVRRFGRPTEPLFGAAREFLPRRIAVDARENLYVVSEGSIDGLVMMNTSGGFIGYFGANRADMSLRMVLQRLFLSDEQLDQFIRNEAASPSNVTIDAQSLVYTVTAGTDRWQSIRKFTVSGRNLFERVFGSTSFRDIHVSQDGLMAAVAADGRIFEYDSNGTMLFRFGGLDRGDQRLGLLSNPTAIERLGEQLVVLDRDKNALVLYGVTDFARRVHEGVRLFVNGFYAEARPYFEQVLNDNGLVLMAYQGIADAEFSAGDYAGALPYYRYANDRDGFSETFWELRNAVLQRYLGAALGALVFGWAALSVFGRLERQRHWLDPLRRLGRAARRVRLLDDVVYMFRFIRHPADGFYEVRYRQRGSLLFALLVYAWIVAVRLVTLYLTSFIFSPFSATWQIEVETEILYTVVLIVLWNAANYLVATISDGEGSLRQVIIGTAYSLFPYTLFALPLALLSNLLTLNEVFIYTFSSQLMLFWCGVMLVIMVMEVHNYSFAETVRNLLTTLFTMAIFLLTAYILYVLFSQLYEFVMAIIREVGLRG